MISVESGNLDIIIAELLAVVLGIPHSLGHAIYLTPKSATARIEIFENVARYAFPTMDTTSGWDDEPRKLQETVNQVRKQDRRRVEALLKRARAIATKRHQVIHEAWGLRADTQEVARRSIPIKPGTQFAAVPLAVLTTIIGDLRRLIDDVIDLKNEFSHRRATEHLVLAQLPSPDKIQ